MGGSGEFGFGTVRLVELWRGLARHGKAVEVWRDWMRPDVAWRGGYGETWSGGVSWVGVRHGMARRLSIFLTRRK